MSLQPGLQPPFVSSVGYCSLAFRTGLLAGETFYSTSGAFTTATNIYAILLHLPRGGNLRAFQFTQGSTASFTTSYYMGLYDLNKSLLASASGSCSSTAYTTNRTAVTATAIRPGNYWLGITFNNTSTNAQDMFYAAPGCAVVASGGGGPMPSTLTITGTTQTLPLMGVYIL